MNDGTKKTRDLTSYRYGSMTVQALCWRILWHVYIHIHTHRLSYQSSHSSFMIYFPMNIVSNVTTLGRKKLAPSKIYFIGLGHPQFAMKLAFHFLACRPIHFESLVGHDDG